MFKHFRKKAGSGVPSANRITLLHDADGDGVAETARCPRHSEATEFVGPQGSWNREPRSGYKVIFVPFSGGQPVDVMTGFLNADGEAMGRPVGVAVDKRGSLLVVDDVGNTVWRVSAAERGTRSVEDCRH